MERTGQGTISKTKGPYEGVTKGATSNAEKRRGKTTEATLAQIDSSNWGKRISETHSPVYWELGAFELVVKKQKGSKSRRPPQMEEPYEFFDSRVRNNTTGKRASQEHAESKLRKKESS